MELLRQPIFLILTCASAAFIVFLAVSPYFGLGDDVKLVKSSVMATLLLCGVLTAVLLATTSLTAELKGGTALAVLSKPVDRSLFILGKLLGVCATIAIMVYINLLAILLASRMGYDAYGGTDPVGTTIFYTSIAISFAIGGFINYFLEKNFVSNTVFVTAIMTTAAFVLINFLDHEWNWQEFAVGVDWQMVPATVCLLFMLWTIASLAILCATRLETMATLTVCVLVVMVGLVSDYFFGTMTENGSWIGKFLYAAIPNWQNFWLTDAIEAEKGIPWSYVANLFAYMLCFVAMFTAGAFTLFHNRELN